MITDGHKTSILVPSQLPRYIRDDDTYATFVTFLQAYYEWMEQSGNVLDGIDNLLNYRDIDQTTSQFLNYFINDFLPYFPEDALISKTRALKFARQLYESKGTPASYQFLFRILYNSECDIFDTGDAVLKPSDGIWYVPKSLNLLTSDPNFLNINNLRLFGQTSKAFATIETSYFNGIKTEVFISNIERLFQSGEFVTVVDNNNQPVLFNGSPISAKIVGQISQININPLFRGLLYANGNPVVIYGGLSSANGIGASAVVGSTTTGSIQRINVVSGGYGYQVAPNTIVNITNAPGAIAVVGQVQTQYNTANVGWVPYDMISLKRFDTIGNGIWNSANAGNTNYNFANIALSNANTSLVNAFSFQAFTTYPIATINTLNGGGGITILPTVSVSSSYQTELTSSLGEYGNLSTFGILAPIQIINPGNGYRVNDQIIFSGGSGVGANAIVSSVAANGAITGITYVNYSTTTDYPLGGLGYTQQLPAVSVLSANVQASNASLVVPTTLGNGATFSLVVNRIGAITSINITNYGQDYVSTPNVSLIIVDVAVSNVATTSLPQSGYVAYQGTSYNSRTFSGIVDSIKLISPNANPLNSIYNLRLYNYVGTINVSQSITTTNNSNIIMNVNSGYGNYGANGAIYYGDGTAQAIASFLNGLTIGQGGYISSQGQLSSFSVLQSTDYNNYTYQLTVEKEIAKYRDILLNLLHPTGMNMIGVYAVKSNNAIDIDVTSKEKSGETLFHYTGSSTSNGVMNIPFTTYLSNTYSTNIIQLTGLGGVNIANIATVNTNTYINLVSNHGSITSGKIIGVNTVSNTITMDSNTWLTYGNVATITATSGTNIINIKAITNSYNVINNGHYSNTADPLLDIVFIGDYVQVSNNPAQIVTNINYVSGTITVQNNWTSNATGYMTVNRNFVANSTSVTFFT